MLVCVLATVDFAATADKIDQTRGDRRWLLADHSTSTPSSCNYASLHLTPADGNDFRHLEQVPAPAFRMLPLSLRMQPMQDSSWRSGRCIKHELHRWQVSQRKSSAWKCRIRNLTSHTRSRGRTALWRSLRCLGKTLDLTRSSSRFLLVGFAEGTSHSELIGLMNGADNTCSDSDDLVETQRFNTGLPRVPGHEIVGDIVAVHQSERQFKVGDRIGCGWHGSHCGMCTWCRAGDFVECENEEIVGASRLKLQASMLTER